MTDTDITNADGTPAPDDALPTSLEASMALVRRMPSQRVVDLILKLEGGVPFMELLENQPTRVIAFRILLRDYPFRDPTSLWMHAYDCEVDLLDVDPTLSLAQMLSPPSATTGT